MGLRDRDYTQSNYSSKKKRRKYRTDGRSVTGILIFINVALWFANGLLFNDNLLTNKLLLQQRLVDEEVALLTPEIQSISFLDPVTCYRFVTYGFAHSPRGVWHILFNMLALLMFGYGMMLGVGPDGFGFVRGENVEGRLGRLEFTIFYLLTIIIGGIVFALINANEPRAAVLGASGGVCGIVILFAWLYPKKMLWIWGVLPMPMWAIGILIVMMDAWGAAGYGCCGIAYSVHLAGAAFGTLYYFLFLKKERTLTGWLKSAPMPKSQRTTRLWIETPDDMPSDSQADDDDFNRLLDDVLKRYGEVGEAGLTPEEREFLQRASRRFAEKNRK